MEQHVVTFDGVDPCVEAFGEPGDPTVLLIAGGGQSMVWWEAELCARIAGHGRHVVRYDHRDTGRSTTSPAGEPSYTADDLATDPLRILDALDVAGATSWACRWVAASLSTWPSSTPSGCRA